MTAAHFIARWQHASGSELANAQSFVRELAELLGEPPPNPAREDTRDNDYVFERRVIFRHGDGASSEGRIDCYKRGHFVLEAKKLRQGAQTKGFDDALQRARGQAEGYARALQEAGIEQDPRLLQSFLFGDTRIRQVIDGWLDQKLSFDAIFASSDVTAISLMSSLNERGIAIPSQVRLVGYDDIALTEHVHPTLTTIRQPTAEAGRALVDLLFEALAGQPRRAIVLPAELIRRESSA